MIKIKALNESEDTSDEDVSQSYLVTREAEEDGLTRVYNEAIRNLSAGEEEEAKQLLLKLNDSLSDKTIRQKCSSEAFYQRLQFGTLKNLGIITNDINYYLDALELDSTDVSLWLKTGRRAALLLNYQLARNCYESAFRLSPENWVVIDRLIETTFIVHDLYHCFRHCCYAIDRDPSYTKAVIIFNECLSLHPILHKNMDEKYKKYMGDYDPDEYESVVNQLRQLKAKRRQHFEEDRIRQEAKRPRLTLFLDRNSNSLTLSSIGLKLKTLYDKIKKNNWFLSTPIDISFESGHNSQTDSCGNESGSANTSADESQSTAETKEKEVPSADKESVQTAESESESFSKPRLKRSNSNRNSTSSTFPSEFVDKRRSSRVKNILNKSKDIDERNVSESILDLLPECLKTAAVEERPITPEADEQKNVFKCINVCEKTESDYINGFFDRIKSMKSKTKFFTIDDLFEIYLCEVGLIRNLIIPSVFTELYAIYRERHELPCGPLTVIGRDIELEQIWMCLTANELKFNRNEAIFLTQILFHLELILSADHFKEFVVRLSMLRGTKENDNDFLVNAMDILMQNEIEVMASNKAIIKYDAIKSILDSQSRENMSQMMAEHHFEELIKILRDKPESELKDEEINLLNDAIVSSGLWQKGIDILCTRNELNNECLSTIRQCLETGKRARLKHPLAVKLVKLAAEGYSVLPWICLYWGLIAEGVESNNAKSPIIKFLKLGHQYLGKRGTCTSHGGEFLLLALNHFLENDVEEEIIRCFTCLYNFPLRKIPSNPLVSSPNVHKSPHIQLKWEHCDQLYHYFAPEELPEYDSVLRQTGITQEIEGLFSRIVELIPCHLRPDDKTEPIVKYIENGEPIPEGLTNEKTQITETIYYLLADYYFKNTEFKKARLYYLYDLSLNPNRFDSWAASALARTWEVDQQLLSGEVNDQSFYDLTIASQRCFQKALSLERGNTKLWLEFGHFVYNISSSASRFRKTSLFKSQEDFKIQSEDMIKIAKNCFESALKTDEGEELWLPYYMLGKVMEKCSLSSGASALLTAIKYYEWAELCLYADGTSYPKRIQYYNPPPLAVEALEIHYRIHASILKYLTYNQKFSSRVLKRLKLHLIRALRSPFTKQSNQSSNAPTIPLDHDYTSAATSESSVIACDSVTELVNDLIDSVALREQKVDINALRTELIVMCLNAMRRCVDRYPAHYKSTYRLASYYHLINDNSTAKQLLLGIGGQKSVNINLPTDNTGTDSSDNAKAIPGLFAERKGNNMFNGIWRIPIDDIDRPGSFSAHMFRSTFLLIRVCTFTNDYHQLCTIAIQLSRTPEAGKKFLRDSDRQILSKLAFDSCVLLLKSRLGSMTIGTRDWTVVDVQKIFDRFIKSGIFVKESNEMIRELFAVTRR